MFRLSIFVSCVAVALLGCQGTLTNSSDPLAESEPVVPPAPTTPTTTPSDPRTPQTPQYFQCDAETSLASAPRIVRLDARQYARAVSALFHGRSRDANRDHPPYEGTVPFGLANAADRFSTHAPSYGIGEAEIEQVVAAAESVSQQLAQQLAEPEASCLAGNDDFAECISSLVADKGALLFGTPLTEEEVDVYASLAVDLQDDMGTLPAAAASFGAMLRAPQFLFRTELGSANATGQRELTPYEIASALSYTLTDGPPDQALWEAAERGALAHPAEIGRQVERLLVPLEENAPMARFLREYVRYDQAGTVAKVPAENPLHDAELLQDDTRRFVGDVLASHGRRGFLHAFLTLDTGVARAATEDAYGLSGLGSTPERVTFPAGQRAGILSQPSWLVAHSVSEANDPIRRGRFVRESLLCGEVPPLPVDDIPPLEAREDATLREILREHRENATCAGCHNLMDPLGLGFEGFDHFGRFRTMEGTRPVDATGTLEGAGDQDGPYDGPIEFAQRLAQSSTVRSCFVLHAYEFWRGMSRREAPGCGLAEADRSYEESEGDLVAMITAFFTSKSFLLRETETP